VDVDVPPSAEELPSQVLRLDRRVETIVLDDHIGPSDHPEIIRTLPGGGIFGVPQIIHNPDAAGAIDRHPAVDDPTDVDPSGHMDDPPDPRVE
jgi:hypothetical protein